MNKVKVRFDEKAVDAIFRDVDQSHLPGAAIGIAIGGVPVYRKGFGLASMELPVTLTPRIRMRIHSITKQFTCLAYLLLCEEGKAGIDDFLGEYLPELHPVTHRVTMRQLMSNTSGLRDACEVRWFFSGIERTVPARELLALYRDIEDVNAAPGEAWCYNNGGFRILSAVIEKLDEKPLEEVFRKRLFEPIGMHDTLLRRIDTDFVPNSASMHTSASGGGYERKYVPGEILGEGGIVSTVDDMLRWLRNMANPVVGKRDTWALMTASQKLLDGSATGYGLGLTSYPYHGYDAISHGGGGLGSNAQLVRIPGADLDVIAMANRKDVCTPELVGKVLDVCLGIESEARRSITPCASGLFRSEKTGRVVQLLTQNDCQMAVIDGVEKWNLLPSSDGALRTADSWFWNLAIRLQGHTGRPHGIHYQSFGCTDELLSVPAEAGPRSEPVSGDYHSDGLGIRMAVRAASGEVSVLTEGRFGSAKYRLEAIAQRLWRVTHESIWGATLTVAPNAESLSLRTSRTWQVHFRRVS